MFDLEKSIADWRKQMLDDGIQTPVPLEELEIHLREDIVLQIKSGLNEQRAFEIAVCQIGQAGVLKKEFKKVHAESWNHSLAIAAWAAFVISFFLPSYSVGSFFGGGGYLLGYQCALAQDAFWFTSMAWQLDIYPSGIIDAGKFADAGVASLVLLDSTSLAFLEMVSPRISCRFASGLVVCPTFAAPRRRK